MRLQKYMAHCGVSSRRKCEDIIKEGRVKVNGKLITNMGVEINPDIDKIMLDDKVLKLKEEKIYIILNKPRATVTTVTDQFNRKTVIDQIHWKGTRIYPVGRLDYDTEGLLILTNDGGLAYSLTHPSLQIEKEYVCLVKGFPTSNNLLKLKNGIDIGGFVTSPAKIKLLKAQNNNGLFSIIIREGKNRQIRRMFEAINHPVLYLKRIRVASLKLGNLQVGDWRYLTSEEIKLLKKLTI